MGNWVEKGRPSHLRGRRAVINNVFTDSLHPPLLTVSVILRRTHLQKESHDIFLRTDLL